MSLSFRGIESYSSEIESVDVTSPAKKKDTKAKQFYLKTTLYNERKLYLKAALLPQKYLLNDSYYIKISGTEKDVGQSHKTRY